MSYYDRLEQGLEIWTWVLINISLYIGIKKKKTLTTHWRNGQEAQNLLKHKKTSLTILKKRNANQTTQHWYHYLCITLVKNPQKFGHTLFGEVWGANYS
jgi:hypothetical protein